MVGDIRGQSNAGHCGPSSVTRAKGTRLSVEDRVTWAEAIVRRKGQLDIGATEYRPKSRPRKDKGPSDVSLSPLAKCNLRMPSVGTRTCHTDLRRTLRLGCPVNRPAEAHHSGALPHPAFARPRESRL